MKEPRVYKTSPILLVFVGLLFIFFIGMLVLAFGATSFWIMGPFMIFFLFFFGWFFLVMASKTIVSDDEIAIQGLLGTKSIN